MTDLEAALQDRTAELRELKNSAVQWNTNFILLGVASELVKWLVASLQTTFVRSRESRE